VVDDLVGAELFPLVMGGRDGVLTFIDF